MKEREFWLLPQASLASTEFSAARDWLAAVQSPLSLESVDSFLLLAAALAAPLPPLGPAPGAPLVPPPAVAPAAPAPVV
jgi:hypothetical protein